MTNREAMKQVFGVNSINGIFLDKIREITFQQTKAVSLRGVR